MNAERFYEIYNLMKTEGVVIFGAGDNGHIAIEVLEKINININMVIDRSVVEINNYKCSKIDDLPDKLNCLCIITPYKLHGEISEKLKQIFPIVVDFQYISFLNHGFPEEGYSQYRPFGHYESPYLTTKEVEQLTPAEDMRTTILDVDCNLKFQNKMLTVIVEDYMAFKQMISSNQGRYRADNNWYGVGDACVLYSFIKKYRPNKIIEIGSGYSTCLSIDTNKNLFNGVINITCIEPYPDRLISNGVQNDEVHFIKDFVQNVDMELFTTLKKNDILFIDSSHVAREGGDILFEYFEVLPRLASGVIIHVHDIPAGFSYSKQWLLEGRCYNEAYILRALLMNNGRYEILYYNDMMQRKLQEAIDEDIDTGCSIWLRKR